VAITIPILVLSFGVAQRRREATGGRRMQQQWQRQQLWRLSLRLSDPPQPQLTQESDQRLHASLQTNSASF